jgi:hypothetical protein
VSPGTWIEEGPGPEVDPGKPAPPGFASGAAQTFVTDPVHADSIYLGSVNGGIWQTTNATSAATWLPDTDNLTAPSIDSMEMDPTNSQVVLAGSGFTSSFLVVDQFGNVVGPGTNPGHLLLTTNGGGLWQEIVDPAINGQSITGLGIRGNTVLVATISAHVYRSTTGGVPFQELTGVATGLPAASTLGRLWHLQADPSNGNRYYLVSRGGLYVTSNSGSTWINVSQNDSTPGIALGQGGGGLAQILPFSSNAEMHIGSDGHLYVAVAVTPGLAGGSSHIQLVAHTTDQGAHWTRMDAPKLPAHTPDTQGNLGFAPAPILNVTGGLAGAPITVTTIGSAQLGLQTPTSTPPNNNNTRVRISGVQLNGGGLHSSNGDWVAIAAPPIAGTTTPPANQFLLYDPVTGQPAVSNGTAVPNTGTWLHWESANPGGQGGINLSIAVDPANSKNVYVGGDSAGDLLADAGAAFIVRGDSTILPNNQIPSSQWAPIVLNPIASIPNSGALNGSSPHSDTRKMRIDANGNLLLSCDGGIYRRSLPTSPQGGWTSLNTNIRTLQFFHIAVDANTGDIGGGLQDNGTPIQSAAGNLTWNMFGSGDGSWTRAVDTGGGSTLFYRNDFERFAFPAGVQRVQANATETSPTLNTTGGKLGSTVDGPLPGVFQPNQAGPASSNRLVIAGNTQIWESTDKGDNLTAINGTITNANAIAYGNPNNPDALWATSDDGNSNTHTVFNRLTATASLSQVVPSYIGQHPNDVVMATGDPTRAYVLDGNQNVFVTFVGASGRTWVNITGDLQSLSPNGVNHIAYIPSSSGDRLAVATNNGVLVTAVTSVPTPGSWSRVGTNLPFSASLAFDIVYDTPRDRLVIGTCGRSAWSLTGASQLNLAPLARCKDVTVSADANCQAQITTAQVDAGSSDPDGDPITLALSSTGPFTLGTSSVTLTASDKQGNSGTCTANVTVIDTTAPVITPPPTSEVPVCGPGTITVGQATAKDNCDPNVVPTGEVIKFDGQPVNPPIPITNGTAPLGFGTYVIEWDATDGTNPATPVDQQVLVLPKIEANGSFLVDDRGQIENSDGSFGLLLNAGSTATSIGSVSKTGSVESVASVTLANQAEVFGSITSDGTISSTGTVTGTRTPHATVVLPALPTLPAFPPQTQQGFTLNPGDSRTISPASYGDVFLDSGTTGHLTTLVFDAGDFFLHSFTVNSAVNVRVQVTPETRIFVQTTMAFRTPFLNASGQVQPVLLGFAGTSLVVETQFNGTLLAPNASVAFGINSGVTYTGSFYAKSIEVRPQSILVCEEGPTPELTNVPPPATCSDGVLDGTETAVDCGGGACAPCANGKACLVNSDCQSDDCTNDICVQPTQQQLTASLTVFADWGSGYCADLTVNNPASIPTRSWTATVTTGAATIYDTWNGTFSGTTGTITITPSFSWNQVIPAHGTDHSIGFCANRTPPTSGARPTLVSEAGTF